MGQNCWPQKRGPITWKQGPSSSGTGVPLDWNTHPGDQLHLLHDVAPGQPGYGTVHHVAFRVPDRPALLEMLERVQATRMPCSGEVDRFFFRSVYFREPGGMLFEIATDDPGFTVDEPAESLGEALKLTAAHEGIRAAIEAQLPPLSSP